MASSDEGQAHLDTDVQAITKSLVAVELEINQLKNAAAAGHPIDFTNLDALVGKIKGDEPVGAPVDQGPDVPADPVVVSTPGDSPDTVGEAPVATSEPEGDTPSSSSDDSNQHEAGAPENPADQPTVTNDTSGSATTEPVV